MLAELRLLLAALPATTRPSGYRAAIVEDNVLLKRSAATRRSTAQRLVELYALETTQHGCWLSWGQMLPGEAPTAQPRQPRRRSSLVKRIASSLLLDPPDPNERLRTAAGRYRASIGI
jgi:hypothetical protein